MPEPLSRRSLLSRGAALGFGSVLGGLISLFPESNVALASSGRKLPGFINAPADLVLSIVDGPRRATTIQAALRHADVKALLAAVPHLAVVPSDARVTDATWARGTEEAVLVAVPLVGDGPAQGALFYGLQGGKPSTWIVELPDATDVRVANAYVMEGGVVQTKHANSNTVTSTANACTVDCLLNAVQRYGCSGLSYTLCAVSIIGCGVFFNPLACLGAVACTFYCGYAFARATCYCCGLSC